MNDDKCTCYYSHQHNDEMILFTYKKGFESWITDVIEDFLIKFAER